MPGDEEYKAKLAAQIRAEIERLKIALEVIEGKNMSVSGLSVTSDADHLRGDEFHNMGILEASRKYLVMTNRTPKTSAEIAQALRAGGIKAQTSNLKASVNTILSRDGVSKRMIEKLPNGKWGLPEWYADQEITSSGP